MSAIFDHIISKFETAINVRVPTTAPAGSTTAAAAAANSTAITGADGMSAIAMLAVLTDFEASYREAMIIQYSAQATASGTAGTQRTGTVKFGLAQLFLLCWSASLALGHLFLMSPSLAKLTTKPLTTIHHLVIPSIQPATSGTTHRAVQ
jgi:hypothetical protein